MANILKNVNRMALSQISDSYSVERVSEGGITDKGRYEPEQTETFVVLGNFQPYNPRLVHSQIVKENLGDKTEYLKIFYPLDIDNAKMDFEDIIKYDGQNWIVVGVPDFTKHGSIAYIVKLGGTYATQRQK